MLLLKSALFQAQNIFLQISSHQSFFAAESSVKDNATEMRNV